VNNTANNSIDLLVTTTGLEWTGTNSSSWDYSTYNWLDPDGASQDIYADGDAVNFSDITTNYTVSIPATVTPGGITVNTTSNYFFGGPAGISGSASLIKTGPGILTIANSNNVFTGGTFINQGTLQLADMNYGYPYPGGALNDNGGVVTVANGGTLDVNGIEVPNYQSYGPDGYNVYITGAGVNGNGALVNNNTSNNDNADAGYVTLTGNATVGGLGDVNVRHGVSPQLTSQSGAYTLTKVGSGQFRVRYNTVVSTNFGNINILQGIVSYESSNTNGFGDPTKTIFIGSGAGFALGTSTAPFKKQIIASNNATIYCYGGGSVLATPVTLVGGAITINANYFNAITFSNVLSGPAGVNISYNSPVTFAAPNTYTGATYVSDCNAAPGSILHLIGYGSITNSSGIQLQGTQSGQAYAGGLDVSGRVDGTLTLVNNQTFRGDNGSYVNGSVVATSGATLTPGGLNNIQYFNVSNNVTLSAGSTVVADVSIDTGSPSNDVINVTGALSYGGTLQLNPSGTAPLTAGSAFKLFNFGSQSGNFATLAGSPGTGLGWTFNPATGVATVVQTLPSTPTNITYTVTGSTLNLSWPANYQGWLVQSNSQKLNVSADWFDISNTAAGTSYSVTITPGVANVFYRLRHP
jgi:autotransporter-associated beta strand protein